MAGWRSPVGSGWRPYGGGPRDTGSRRIYVRCVDPIRTDARPLQRLRDRIRQSPHAAPRPPRHAGDHFWNSAPSWLRLVASLPLYPFEQRLRERLRQGLPTDVVARVPIWIPDVRAGYVMDFLLPESRVGIVIDNERSCAGNCWGAMQRELGSIGIVATRYPLAVVRDDPAHVVAEVRRQLGLFDK